MARLGVNIDHVATLRQARGTRYPDPIAAGSLVEHAGADHITVHLREDRRHIQDHDVRMLRKTVTTALNLEMAATDAMVDIAIDIKPDWVTLVPEKRQELTTEGGLDVARHMRRLRKVHAKLVDANVAVAYFIDPDRTQLEACKELGAETVELHTGAWCDAQPADRDKHLVQLQDAARYGRELELRVAAGHGLHYENMRDAVRALPEVEEYNIGHSMVARAVFVGLERAVREMRALIDYQQPGDAL